MKELRSMLQYTKGLNVLYVEDDVDLVESTNELFENYFARVDVAYDGQEGLDKYLSYHRENGIFYDLVITDINMPNMNGMEMSSAILQKNTMQAIVITSAHNEVAYLSNAIELGVSGFVTKPINNDQLIKVFYKAAQAICDHKFVEEHVGQMEELNLQLEEQNSKLLASNLELEKSFRLLDTMVHKEQLVHPKEDDPTVELNSDDAFIQEQIRDMIHHDLYELRDIHAEIDVNIINVMNSVDSIAIDTLPNLVELFSKYASVLAYYSFFDRLSLSMANFSSALKENPLPDNAERVNNIFMLLESFMYVLGRWQSDLASGDESKINALDASIISDMHTITNMWTEQEEAVAGDLDDIFDF